MDEHHTSNVEDASSSLVQGTINPYSSAELERRSAKPKAKGSSPFKGTIRWRRRCNSYPTGRKVWESFSEQDTIALGGSSTG